VELASIVDSIGASALGEWMRTSLKALPIVEAIHVMAGAVVFGTILIVDLRLLGFPNARRAITRVEDELLRWTWTAFAAAVVSGGLLFAANASTYFMNTAFRLKMLALLLAGVNAAVFQLGTFRSVAAWDKDVAAPLAGRLAGAASILIWVGVIFLGRWVGFTKGYDFQIPADVELDFEFLQ
jgi:hypothetical protein